MSETPNELSGTVSLCLNAKHTPDLQFFLSALTREKTRKVIDSLPFPVREVILLYFYEELSRKQIAAILHICPGTVHNRLNRGLWLIKTQFAKKPKNPV
jgi:RNA polymerase sigma factor (sigma-70 family)